MQRASLMQLYLLLILLLAGSSGVLGGTETATAGLSILLPPWAVNRSTDFALNFSAADSAAVSQEQTPISFRGKQLERVSHRKGYFHGNVAVVKFGPQFITAVRKIQFYLTPRTSVPDYPLDSDPKKKWISWWSNKISLCIADPATLQPQHCINYDPRNWTDCMWNGGFETLGPEDPRLIIWPSKGLFMMFNSKPWPVNPNGTKPGDTQCAGPWAQQPWLAPVATYTGAGSPFAANSLTKSSLQQRSQQQPSQQQQQQDPWTRGLIRLQYLPPELQQGAQEVQQRLHKLPGSSGPLLHKEKNWNAFIYNDELYFSQNFAPHVVLKPSPDGSCSVVHVTDGLAFKQLPAKPRGNTQAVLVPAAVSGLHKAMYLGIVHTEVERKYTNYLYQMEAEPPFAITAVSAPLPLVPGQHPRVPAWDTISFPLSLQLLEDTNQLLIGYGSGDQVPRVKLMTLREALELFSSSSSSSQIAGSAQQQRAAAGANTATMGGPKVPPLPPAAAAVAAATDAGLSAKLASKLAGKLAVYSPRAQVAAQAALAAVQEAIGLQPASTAG